MQEQVSDIFQIENSVYDTTSENIGTPLWDKTKPLENKSNLIKRQLKSIKDMLH